MNSSRFAQFFINPLAKVEAMDREVQSVDSGKACQECFFGSRDGGRV